MSEIQFLNEREAAQKYNLSIPWLRRARREKFGPRYLKVVGLIRYRREDLEDFLASCVVKPSSQKEEAYQNELS